MADAVAAARLELSADTVRLVSGIGEAQKAVGELGQGFEALTRGARAQGQALEANQRKVSEALVELTGTAAQKELAAFDRKWASLLKAQEKTGQSSIALHRALEAERAKITARGSLGEIKEFERIQVSMKETGTAAEGLKGKHENLTAGMRDAKGAAAGLAGGLSGVGGEAGRVTGDLIKMVLEGVGPLAAAAALAAVTVGKAFAEMEERSKLLKQQMDLVAQSAVNAKVQLAALNDAKTGGSTAEQAKGEAEINRLLEERIRIEHQSLSLFDLSGTKRARELAIIDEQIQQAQQAQGSGGFVKAAEEKRKAAEDAAKQALDNAMEDFNVAHKRTMEIRAEVAETAKKASEEAEKATKKAIAEMKKAAKEAKELDDSTVDAQQKIDGFLFDLHATAIQREIKQEWQKFQAMIDLGRKYTLDVSKLQDEREASIDAIRRKYADAEEERQQEIEDAARRAAEEQRAATEAVAAAAEESRKQWSSITIEIEKSTAMVEAWTRAVESGATALKLNNGLGWMGDPGAGVHSLGMGAINPFASDLGMIPHAASGLEMDIGGAGATDSRLFQAMVSPGEHVSITSPGKGGARVVVNNYGPPLGAVSVSSRDGPDGEEIVLTIAADVRGRGVVGQALEATYGLRRPGARG